MTHHATISVSTATHFLTQMFEHHGFPPEAASFITETLIDAERQGIRSHGLQRVAMYDHKLRHHMINPAAASDIVNEFGACAVLDSHDSMGQLVARDAMDLAIAKAREHGIGMIAVRNSNHFGTCGYYARMAADQGFIGMVATNSNPLVVPTHSTVPALGSNPLAFAVGSGDDQLLFDAATCTVSLGKIELLAATDDTIPGAWAVDEHGDLDHRASAVIERIRHAGSGGLTPLGGVGENNAGHKGYGLGLVVEVLTGILSGGLASLDLKGHSISHWFTAVSLDAFGGAEQTFERLRALFRRIRQLPSSDGHPVMIPGDKERAHEKCQGDSLPSGPDDVRASAQHGTTAWHSCASNIPASPPSALDTSRHSARYTGRKEVNSA